MGKRKYEQLYVSSNVPADQILDYEDFRDVTVQNGVSLKSLEAKIDANVPQEDWDDEETFTYSADDKNVIDENGKAVYFTTKITAESANTNVTKKSSCDVNADGVVDLLDITYCQKFYRMGEKSIDWNDFKHCDLDGNGLIDIEDLIIILKVM